MAARFNAGEIGRSSSQGQPSRCSPPPSGRPPSRLLGGEPVGQALHLVEPGLLLAGPHQQAKADWKAGRMALPKGEHEFIPLPDDPPPPSEPVS